MLYKNQYRYVPIVKKWARLRGLPEELVLAIIAVESGFNPKSYRREPHINDASFGLMQILERTAVGMGFQKPLFTISHPLFDPETNIKYGTEFLRRLWTQYGGNRDAVIAAYNMGHPRKAENTTAHIIRIFGKPQTWWTYANQPYVDNVNRHVRYFRAMLDGDELQMRTVEKEIRAAWRNKMPKIFPLIPLLVFGVLVLSWRGKK